MKKLKSDEKPFEDGDDELSTFNEGELVSSGGGRGTINEELGGGGGGIIFLDQMKLRI